MILTLDEIVDINQNAEFDSAIGYARAIESAVLERLNPRVAELEALLRECREALVLTQDGSEFAACLPDEWSFAADKDWHQMQEAIAKIDEVLK